MIIRIMSIIIPFLLFIISILCIASNLKNIFRFQLNNSGLLVVSYFIFFGFFHILSMPLILYQLNIYYFELLTIALFMTICIYNFLFQRKNTVVFTVNLFLDKKLYLSIPLFIFLFWMVYGNIYYEHDARFYVANINELVSNPGVFMANPVNGKMGWPFNFYKLMSFSVFLGSFSQITKISVIFFVNWIQASITVLIYSLSINSLFQLVFKKKRYILSGLFFFSVWLYYLFRPNFYIPDDMLEMFPYIGKGVFYTSGVIAIYLILYEFFEQKKKEVLFILAFVGFAGIGMVFTSIINYILILAGFILYVSFLRKELYVEALKGIIVAYIPVYLNFTVAIFNEFNLLLTLIVIALASISYWLLINYESKTKSLIKWFVLLLIIFSFAYTLYATGYNLENIYNDFFVKNDILRWKIRADFTYFIYIIMLTVHLFTNKLIENNNVKHTIFGVSILVAILFTSPFNISFISDFFTSKVVYERVYLSVLLTYSTIILINELFRRSIFWKVIVSLGTLFLIISVQDEKMLRPNKFYSNDYYLEYYSPKYLIMNASVEMGSYFIQKSGDFNVLLFDDQVRDVRQVTNNVILLVDPRATTLDAYSSFDSNVYEVIKILEGSDLSNANKLPEYLSKIDCDYIIMPNTVYNEILDVMSDSRFVHEISFGAGGYLMLINVQAFNLHN